MNARTVARLDVYKGRTRIGELRRTERGAVFEYAPEYVSAHRGDALAAVEGMLTSLCARVAPWVDRLAEIGLDAKQTRHLARIMTERLKELGG